MSKVSELRDRLGALPENRWDAFLAANSNLPGPRANLELMHACADVADATLLLRYAHSDDEFLACCGTEGLGRLMVEGVAGIEPLLHERAADDRWRVREATAMALQRIGDADIDKMLTIAERWADDRSWLVRRAAAAGACEPRLLRMPGVVARVLDLLDTLTIGMGEAPVEVRRGESYRTFRKGMGYCWSVAVAADPGVGVPRFDRWRDSTDPDVAWVVKQNLGKARMKRVLARGGVQDAG